MKTKRANSLWALIALALVLGAISLGGCAALQAVEETKDLSINTPDDLNAIEDGSYQGAWDATLVKVRLEVHMDGGRIRAVDILAHDCGRGRPAEVLAETIVERQSLDVDTVSGATVSSKSILKSAELALASAPRL